MCHTAPYIAAQLLDGPSGPALVFHASGTFIMAAAFWLGDADVRSAELGSVNRVPRTYCMLLLLSRVCLYETSASSLLLGASWYCEIAQDSLQVHFMNGCSLTKKTTP